MNRLQWQWTEFSFAAKGKEVCCLKTALTFVDSVPEIFGPLLEGHRLIIFSRREVTQPHLFAQRILDHGITQLILVPSFLRALLETMSIIEQRSSSSFEDVHVSNGGERMRPLDSIKLWICSGESLTQDLILKFFQYFSKNMSNNSGQPKLCNFYGSTEIMDVTFQVFQSTSDIWDSISVDEVNEEESNEPKNRLCPYQVPLGRPLSNTSIFVLTSDLNLVENGQLGEIYVSGHHVGKGYVGGLLAKNSGKYLQIRRHLLTQSDLPATQKHDQFLYRTGDFGRIQKMRNGHRALFYAGRVDSQIKVRGHRVDLGEIQRVLDSLKFLVKKSIVLTYSPEAEGGNGQKIIVAFVVPKNDQVGEDKIKNILQTKLLEYQLPVVSIVTEIPLLVHGKTDRQKLLKDFHSRQQFCGGKCDENDTERNYPHLKPLLQSISKFTGKSAKCIQLEDYFYCIGGTSLNSVAVISHLRSMGFYIGIQDFVAAKSIRELAKLLRPLNTKINGHHHHHVDIVSQNGNHFVDGDIFFESLTQNHHSSCIMSQVSEIFSYAFANKGFTELYSEDIYEDLHHTMSIIWPQILRDGLSFLARRKRDLKIVGICLNFDNHEKPNCIQGGNEKVCNKVADLFHELGKPLKRILPADERKSILYAYAMATYREVSGSENVTLMLKMGQENVRLAKSRGFIGILAENTSPLTQQLSRDILGYKELCKVQINQYETPDGSRPFIFAPDDQVVTICWKQLLRT